MDGNESHPVDNKEGVLNFGTYFVLNQEVLIRRFSTSKDSSRVESYRAKITLCDGPSFVLTLLSVAADSPFTEDEFVELLSDRFDLGVRLSGICHDVSGQQLRFEANDDLELFHRRKYWRASLIVWHGMVRSNQSKQPLYAVWEKALTLREEHNLDPSIQVQIVRSPLNLSAGGVRIELESPVRLKEKCLLYLCLDDGAPTVCALCEVVWVEPGESDSTRSCGLRFCNLLESDLKRIDVHVIKHCKFDPSKKGTPIEQSYSV